MFFFSKIRYILYKSDEIINLCTDKPYGHDGEPKKLWGSYSMPKKTKGKGSVRSYMKDQYDNDSASPDPYKDDSSEEEGEIDNFMYKTSAVVTHPEAQRG